MYSKTNNFGIKKIITILLTLFIFFWLNSCSANYENNTEESQEISVKLQTKLDTILENFYKKLDMKISDNAKKIIVLEKINYKIKVLKNQKSSNKKLVKILNYIEKSILNKISILKKSVSRNIKIENNMTPILAFGTEKFEENPNEETMQEVIDRWKKVANIFKDTNYRLSFDMIIEIWKKLNKKPEIANEFYEKVVSEIRKTWWNNEKRIILISPVKRSYPENLKLLKIPSKANWYLMAEWHMFAAGPNRCGPYMKWTSWTLEEKEFIKNKIKIALDWSEKNKIPTWVGAWMPWNYNKTFEKWCNNSYSTKEQIAFSSFMAQQLKENKIPFAINADRKFYDREKHIWLEERSEVLDNLVDIMKK